MNAPFSKIFSKQPDEIINGDYFYNVDWFNRLASEINMNFEKSNTRNGKYNNFLEHRENMWLNEGKFLGSWIANIQERTGLLELKNISAKIAAEEKTVMDISSGINMGLIPYIVKLNPEVPCLVTDIDQHLIKCWRIFKDTTKLFNNIQFASNETWTRSWRPFKECDLFIYNIQFAAFDNLNMPLKNNSLNYITSTQGITSTFSDNTGMYGGIPVKNHDKVINEVYRVLKPTGYFVTVETEKNNIEDSLSNKFIRAGFKIECEKTVEILSISEDKLSSRRNILFILQKPSSQTINR